MIASEEDYAKFQQHLDILRPAIARFCASEGFEQIQSGRYPRIRIEKKSDINMYIDLWMTFDDEGRRRTVFTPDVPYDLSAGVYFFTCVDNKCFQCSKSIEIWSGKRFADIDSLGLIEDFYTAANLVSQLNLDSLLQDDSLVTCPVDTTDRMTPPAPNE